MWLRPDIEGRSLPTVGRHIIFSDCRVAIPYRRLHYLLATDNIIVSIVESFYYGSILYAIDYGP